MVPNKTRLVNGSELIAPSPWQTGLTYLGAERTGAKTVGPKWFCVTKYENVSDILS